MEHIVVGKVKFSPSNLRGSLIFNLKLQNWVPNALQLSKLDKHNPELVQSGFQCDFYKNNKVVPIFFIAHSPAHYLFKLLFALYQTLDQPREFDRL